MRYRADLFTSTGRVQFYAHTPDELRGLIDKTAMFVWGWQIVDTTTKKAVEYRAPGGGLLT
jgi:hypothetical protein